MIRFIRSGVIATGKAQEAIAYAKEIADDVSKLVGTNVDVYVQIGGEVGRLSWVIAYDNMAALEAAFMKVNADAAYTQKIKSITDNFMAGSFHDTILMKM